MHVLMTHPFAWPYVTRGAEREVHDTGTLLARRGNRVDLVTGRPDGLVSRRTVDGVRVTYARTPLPAVLRRRGWRRESTFAAVAALGAATSRADVVLSFLYADALGASYGRRDRPVVLKLTGSVERAWISGRSPLETTLLRRALDRAEEVWVNSAWVADQMRSWDVPMHVVPVGADTETFRPCAPRSETPLVLCTSAATDPRKRLVDLLDAWPAVVDRLGSDARLWLTNRADPATRRTLLERLPADLRGSVLFTGVLSDADLAAAYSAAWAVVTPSVHEAFGLVTVEALACGTPVAGVRSGATPQLLDLPGTGTLAEPSDPASLAEAVLGAAALTTGATGPSAADLRARCRAAAARYGWPTVIDEIEARLRRLVR